MSPHRTDKQHADHSTCSATERLFLCARPWALLVALLGVAGCGDSNGVASVHGVVTLDGKPLTEGTVIVTPAEGRMAKGEIQPDGSFALGTFSESDGAKIGTHPVTVLPLPGGEGQPPSAAAKLLPRRYSVAKTSGLTAEVKPNTNNELTIELTSD